MRTLSSRPTLSILAFPMLRYFQCNDTSRVQVITEITEDTHECPNKEIQTKLKEVDEASAKRKCETTCRVGAKVLMRSCRSESIQLCGGGG